MLQTVGFNFYDVFVYAFCILFALICVYPNVVCAHLLHYPV